MVVGVCGSGGVGGQMYGRGIVVMVLGVFGSGDDGGGGGGAWIDGTRCGWLVFGPPANASAMVSTGRLACVERVIGLPHGRAFLV